MWQVIIVDDESTIRQGLKQYIADSQLPYAIAGEARNAAEALALIEQAPPHVLFLDINMPDMNGLDLLRLVKSRHEQIVTVLISGYDYFDYVRQALQLKAYDYLLKPVPKSDLKRLLMKLDQLLREEHGDPEVSDETPQSTDAAHRKGDGSVMLSKVTDYIDDHYYDPDMTVSRVADLFHMNQTYLSKRMKQELGSSFLEYLTELRISKAKEILDHSLHNIKIGDLAVKVGYTNQYYFSRLFKNRVGICPIEYKNREPGSAI
ncbi:response regulator transcription factor [Paenibacillus marinisediminis]